MKYTFCEKMIWFAWNIKLLKNKAKNCYKEIIADLPDIGSITENSLRLCLSDGALWLAFYETCEEKIENEEFGKAVIFIFAKKVHIGINSNLLLR